MPDTSLNRPVSGKPWRARRKRNGVHYFLGLHATREEAEQAEREFDETWPSMRGRYNRVI